LTDTDFDELHHIPTLYTTPTDNYIYTKKRLLPESTTNLAFTVTGSVHTLLTGSVHMLLKLLEIVKV